MGILTVLKFNFSTIVRFKKGVQKQVSGANGTKDASSQPNVFGSVSLELF